MKDKFNFISVLSLFLLPILFVNCFKGSPFSEREQCYKKEYCNTAVSDCIVGSALIGYFLTPRASTSTSSGSITTESSSNDNFSTFDILSAPTTSFFTGKAGSISSSTDVDIFYNSYTSGSASSQTFHLSQIAGIATCNAYTRASQATAANATIDLSFTLLGRLNAIEILITQNLSTSPYLYIV